MKPSLAKLEQRLAVLAARNTPSRPDHYIPLVCPEPGETHDAACIRELGHVLPPAAYPGQIRLIALVPLDPWPTAAPQ